MILFISIFSKTFPPTFIKLIGLNFDTSVEVSLPGFVMGNILIFFSTSSGNSFSSDTRTECR